MFFNSALRGGMCVTCLRDTLRDVPVRLELAPGELQSRKQVTHIPGAGSNRARTATTQPPARQEEPFCCYLKANAGV
jgi:hypothetical protein